MGPSRRSAASPRPGPRGPWAARGAPTAAPPPGPGTIGCAGCGVGVPQGRRGINRLPAPPPAPSSRLRGGIRPPHPGRLSFPAARIMGPSPRSAASPRPGPRGPGRPEARRRPSWRPPPTRSWYHFGCAGCGVGGAARAPGFCTNLTCAAADTFLAPAGGHQPPHLADLRERMAKLEGARAFSPAAATATPPEPLPCTPESEPRTSRT